MTYANEAAVEEADEAAAKRVRAQEVEADQVKDHIKLPSYRKHRFLNQSEIAFVRAMALHDGYQETGMPKSMGKHEIWYLHTHADWSFRYKFKASKR